jgi:subtilase family protein
VAARTMLGILAAAAAVGAAASAQAAPVSVRLAPGASTADLPAGARPLVPPAVAARLAARAALLGNPAPDLRRWYALPQTGPVPPAAPPPAACRLAPIVGAAGPTPDLSPFEDDLPGMGLLALGAEGIGAGVRIGDVEYDWLTGHEDLAARTLPAAPAQPPGNDDHGTAVLSILGAAADGRGVTGLAPAAALRPRSPYSDVPAGRQLDADTVAATIATLAAGLGPGDVLLVEQQAYADPAFSLLGPVELRPAVRDAIAAAVASGVTVVEPAGNGSDGSTGYDVGALGVTGDSGAIIVGAGTSEPGQAGDRVREPYSNFGPRVNLQGYGEAVVAAGYGDLWSGDGDHLRRYTACFSGTSSASATVAGAAAALQGAARLRTGAFLRPSQVRQRLVATGQPQVGAEAGAIGPRPDVAAAVPPAAPVLAPLPTAVIGPGPLGVAWSTSPLPTGRPADQVLLDGRDSGAVVAPGAAQATIPSLTGGAHAIRVRAQDGFGVSALSAARTVTVDATPPATPALQGPADGATVPDAPVTLTWSSPAGDAGGAGRGVDVVLVDGAEAARVEAGVGRATLSLPAGAHQWTVQALDGVGNAAAPPARQVVVGAIQPPPAPALAGPDPDAVLAPGEVTLRWTSTGAGTPGREDDVVIVDGVEVARVPAGAGVARVTLGPGVHSWAVQARSSGGGSPLAPRQIVIDGTPPAAPVPIRPAAGAIVTAGPVTLEWSSPTDDAGGAGRADDVLVLDGREAARLPAGTGRATLTLGAGPHTWSVRALDRVGNASATPDIGLTATPAPAPQAAAAVTGSTAATTPRRRAAATFASAAWSRRAKALTVRLRLAPRAVVTVGRTRVRARAGTVRVHLARPGRVALRISAPGRATVVLRVAVAASGRARPVRP